MKKKHKRAGTVRLAKKEESKTNTKLADFQDKYFHNESEFSTT